MSTPPNPLESFAEGINHLRAFAVRAEHADVKPNHKEGYFALGEWVDDVRARKADLHSNQASQLASLQGWSWERHKRRARSDSKFDFQRSVQALREHVERTGSARVPQMVERKTSELGLAVKELRRQYAIKRLSNSQIEELEALPGWEWDAQSAAFLDHVDEFRDFVARFGHGIVPSSYKVPVTQKPLRPWVIRQRQSHKDGTLHLDRVKILSEIPEWWWS